MGVRTHDEGKSISRHVLLEDLQQHTIHNTIIPDKLKCTCFPPPLSLCFGFKPIWLFSGKASIIWQQNLCLTCMVRHPHAQVLSADNQSMITSILAPLMMHSPPCRYLPVYSTLLAPRHSHIVNML